jgi:hypothetical protein
MSRKKKVELCVFFGRYNKLCGYTYSRLLINEYDSLVSGQFI